MSQLHKLVQPRRNWQSTADCLVFSSTWAASRVNAAVAAHFQRLLEAQKSRFSSSPLVNSRLDRMNGQMNGISDQRNTVLQEERSYKTSELEDNLPLVLSCSCLAHGILWY